MAPAYLAWRGSRIPSILTIHNLAYQGLFPPGVAGLVFFAWPLHPPGKAGVERAEHLAAVKVPMLFLQGTRDALAGVDLMRALVDGLGSKATLAFFEDADHSFHVPVRSGRTDAQVLAGMLDTLAQWMRKR